MYFEKYSNIKEAVLQRYQVILPMVCIMSFFLVGYAAYDREAPVVENDVVTLNYGDKFDVSMINVKDNRTNYNELSINVDTSALVEDEVGSSNVIVEAKDLYNNVTRKTVQVNVEDHVAPNFELAKNDESYFEAGKVVVNLNGSNDVTKYINAIDNADGDITEFIDIDGTLDTSKNEVQTVNLAISDASGNTNEKSFEFVTKDLTAPVISLNTTDEIAVDYGAPFDIYNYMNITDNSGEYDVSLTNEINTTSEETQTTTVVAVDKAGNESRQDIVVTVGDVSAPIIKVSDAEILEGDAFNIRDVLTVIDNKDGNITSSATIEGHVDTSVAGKYTLTISAVDSSNNSASKTVVITVRKSGEGIVNSALSKVGCPYVWGATGPNAFDCSGFTQWAYAQNGKYIGRTTNSQYAGGTKVSSYMPGDLLFFNTEGPLSHVGIYIGNGQMVHAGTSRTGVQVTSIHSAYWSSRFVGAVRY